MGFQVEGLGLLIIRSKGRARMKGMGMQATPHDLRAPETRHNMQPRDAVVVVVVPASRVVVATPPTMFASAQDTKISSVYLQIWAKLKKRP